MTTAPRILLAAGGTGGHLFPAEALARLLLARGAEVMLATDDRGRRFAEALPRAGLAVLPAASPAGSLPGRVKAMATLAKGYMAALMLVQKFAPDVAVGFGGYPSVAPMMAAGHLGVPTLLHEQNAVLGRANRWLAGRARCIFTSFPATSRLPRGARTLLTGNPVRAEIAKLADKPYMAFVGDGPRRIVVTGGSQGAALFGRIIPAALDRLPAHLQARIELAMQVRPEEMEAVTAAMAGHKVKRRLEPFLPDVPQLLGRAHLVICRAGASTMAELTAIGRPAILVPLAIAADDHQTRNAEALSEVGGGWLMPESAFTADALAARLETILTPPPDRLVAAAASAHKLGRPDAAAALADAVMAVATGQPVAPERKAA